MVFILFRKLQQLVGETDFPAIFAYVPWGHHVQIMSKCKDVDEGIQQAEEDFRTKTWCSHDGQNDCRKEEK